MKHQYNSRHKLRPNIVVVHEGAAIPVIQDIIIELKFELMIELGTTAGGFTLVMHDAIPGTEIHSFDIKSTSPQRGAHVDVVWFRQHTNVHFHPHTDVLKECKEVVELCKRPEHKLLYCDNGNKPLEFKLYSKYLNPGDYIAVHDYMSENEEYQPEEINDLPIMKYFKPFRHELFEGNGWTTRFWKRMEN